MTLAIIFAKIIFLGLLSGLWWFILGFSLCILYPVCNLELSTSKLHKFVMFLVKASFGMAFIAGVCWLLTLVGVLFLNTLGMIVY